MKLRRNDVTLPTDVDEECIPLCDVLNSLPTVRTFESCCGHLKYPFGVYFFCYDIGVLSRLARAVSHNYSDGKWEILVETTDTHPYGVFSINSIEAFKDTDEMHRSVIALCDNIIHWCQDCFDEVFSQGFCFDSWTAITGMP